MKVLLLTDSNSIHTLRWANGLALNGVDIHLVSMHKPLDGYDDRVKHYTLPFKAPLGYFLNIFEFNSLLEKINPDVLNVHYATGYGTLGAFHKRYPSLLSIWGSDVYKFPFKTIFHKYYLKFILSKYNALASTSECMATQIRKFNKNKQIFITPFGIDTEAFREVRKNSCDEIIIGTVKTLSFNYGIDVLLHAFKSLLMELPSNLKVKLEIVGGGVDECKLKDLASSLEITDKVKFLGQVSHSQVPYYLNNFDIYVALSRFESFGVAILEASACSIPVVVSDADGPKEVTIDCVTGFVVPRNNPHEASLKLKNLVMDKSLRERMGGEGREHVIRNYTWATSLKKMIEAYSYLSKGS
ncbi:glycosyltransferase [Pseudoalteromonas sp. JSTW]|uniref:glycosyltransferase n=1 Tax=Pseudoalteromonas sp. JSTW TaxID=2752475 RepID=UPI0015D56538|nr:glycosyltransferase [Pseudoalteromonas sp. JSTW]QLJ07985.1 glycosyltransferase [Pseudoalteromonas sp. JSTW]